MEQPRQQTKEDQQADEDERTQAGISADEWETAFEWADEDGGWVEVDGKNTPDDQSDKHALPFTVWPCNWDAARVFMACETQWRRNFRGGFSGLNYPGVDVVLRRTKVADENAVFAQVQAMELAALEVLNG